MSIKNRLSQNIYEVYVENRPGTVSFKVYRQDFFSFTIIGFNFLDDPFDFSVFNSFRAQIRMDDPKNDAIEYTFDVDNVHQIGNEIVLGKTDEDQQEFDELHLITDKGFDLTDFCKVAWIDIEGIVQYNISSEKEVLERNTLIKIKCLVESDTTR